MSIDPNQMQIAIAAGGVVVGILLVTRVERIRNFFLGASTAPVPPPPFVPAPVVVVPANPQPSTPVPPAAVAGAAAQQPLPVSPPHPLVQELRDFEASVMGTVQQRKSEAQALAEREGQETIAAFRKSLQSFIKTWNQPPVADKPAA